MEIKQYKLPDNKKTTAQVFMLILLGLGGFGFLTYALPWLKTVTWNLVSLGIGGVVLFFLFLLLTNKKFWISLNLLVENLCELLLGWAIKMDYFLILRDELVKAEKANEELNKHNIIVNGKKIEIADKLKNNDSELKLAFSKKELCERTLVNNPNDNIAQNTLEETLSIITSNKEYADTMKPIYNDLVKLEDYTRQAYERGVLDLKIAKRDLEKKKDLFETVKVANNAINKAWAVFKGKEINSESEKALDMLRKDIALKIGNIQNGIKITSKVMDSKNLESASKLQTTLKELAGIDISEGYSNTIDNSQTKMELKEVGKGNKYLDIL